MNGRHTIFDAEVASCRDAYCRGHTGCVSYAPRVREQAHCCGYPLGKFEVPLNGSVAVFAHFGGRAMEDVGKVGSGGAAIGIEASFGHRHIVYADSSSLKPSA
jgi:hypothetical protein